MVFVLFINMYINRPNNNATGTFFVINDIGLFGIDTQPSGRPLNKNLTWKVLAEPLSHDSVLRFSASC